jgi:peptide/nickel transport system ATP-binding protein
MKQRTLIALALLLQPKLVILDEPTTALDLLTQEKILRLLKELKKEYGFSLLFIPHDLGIVSELADKVVTMYAGKAVEIAPVREFFQNAAHPYSKGLVNAIPRLTLDDREIVSIPGTPPDMVAEEHGCAFAPRCNRCTPECLEKVPMNTPVAGTTDRYCACWNPMLGGEHSGKDC